MDQEKYTNVNIMKHLIILIIALSCGTVCAQELQSGPNVGDECPAFDPQHVSGPDKGKKTCPMCKYGQGQGVLIWWNTDDPRNIAVIVQKLEAQIEKQSLQKIRVFVMYMNPNLETKDVVEEKLKRFVEKNELKKVAITYIPGPKDEETAGLYNINPDQSVKNTVIVYKKRGAFAKLVNMQGTETEINDLIKSVERAQSSKGYL
jgi:protocatechuate 3,4-dioxygenase beta subunit